MTYTGARDYACATQSRVTHRRLSLWLCVRSFIYYIWLLVYAQHHTYHIFEFLTSNRPVWKRHIRVSCIPLKIYVVRFHGLTRLLSLNPTEREGKEKKEGKKQTYAHTNVGIEKFPAVYSFVESERRQPNNRKRERAPKATSTDFYIIHYYMGARRFLIGYILECVSLYPHTNRPDKRLLIVYHQGCRCVYEWAKRLISRIDVTHNPPNVVYGVTALTVFFFDRAYKYWHSV